MISQSHGRLALAAFSVLALQARASAQGAAIVRPSQIADSSHPLSIQPALAGFRIGQGISDALARLGKPLKVDTLGSGPDSPVSYANLATGITVVGTTAAGVGVILATSRDAGTLDSVRVGDSRASVLKRWGPPAAGSAEGGLWLDGDYVVAVSFDDGARVKRLVIGVGLTL